MVDHHPIYLNSQASELYCRTQPHSPQCGYFRLDCVFEEQEQSKSTIIDRHNNMILDCINAGYVEARMKEEKPAVNSSSSENSFYTLHCSLSPVGQTQQGATTEKTKSIPTFPFLPLLFLSPCIILPRQFSVLIVFFP